MIPSPPIAFYRLRLSPGFGFREAAAVLPYLADLGISHVCVLPMPADSGTAEGLRAFLFAATTARLGVLLDWMPGDPAETVPPALVKLLEDRRLSGVRIHAFDDLLDPIGSMKSLSAGAPFASLFLVEHTLMEAEPPRRLPGAAGTTGAEWSNVLSHLLIDRRGSKPLERVWIEIGGETFAVVLESARRSVLADSRETDFAAEVWRLHRLVGGGITPDMLRGALEEFIVAFPTYRYLVDPAGPSAADMTVIERTVAKARLVRPELGSAVFDRLTSILSGAATASADVALGLHLFIGRVVRAAAELAFHRFHQMIALNEHGGDPEADGLTPGRFHEAMARRLRDGTVGATATDVETRGEDARTRLLAITDLSHDWMRGLADWPRISRPLVRSIEGRRIPSKSDEYRLYQTLVAAWTDTAPDDYFRAQIKLNALVAARGARRETSREDPDKGYEAGLLGFIGALLASDGGFAAAFRPFAQRAALIGALKSLAQLVLKVMMPGIPDFGEGTELWDFSLGDGSPAAAWPIRETLLASLGPSPDWAALATSWPDGRIKMALTARLLAIRKAHSELLRHGAYRPLRAEGASAQIVAFVREAGAQQLIVVVPTRFGPDSRDGRTWPRAIAGRIPIGGSGSAQNLLTGLRHSWTEAIELAQLLEALPFAVLRISG